MDPTTHPGRAPVQTGPQEQGSRGGRRRWRLTVNITPAERAGRIVIGAGAALAGLLMMTSASSVLAVVLELLLVAAGVDLVVTGALGHCPLYKRLGYVPPSLRRPA